jgi:hypothetical protein
MKSSCLVEESPLVVASRHFASRAWTLGEQVAGCWPFLALMSYRFQLLAIFSIFNLFVSFSLCSILIGRTCRIGTNWQRWKMQSQEVGSWCYVIPVDHFLSGASALERRRSATFIPKILSLTGTLTVRGPCCLVIPFLTAISVN